MGRELIFYPAFKDKNTNKYKHILTDINGKPAPVLWRSQSFIDMEFFTTELLMIPNENFDDSCKDYFSGRYDSLYQSLSNDEDVNNAPSYVYELNENTIYNLGKTNGIVSGYVPLDELKAFHQAECPQEYLTWQMSKPLPPEVFIEIPDEEKRKYGRIYTVDTYSKEYVCSVLREILDDIFLPYEWEGEKCILVYYSF